MIKRIVAILLLTSFSFADTIYIIEHAPSVETPRSFSGLTMTEISNLLTNSYSVVDQATYLNQIAINRAAIDAANAPIIAQKQIYALELSTTSAALAALYPNLAAPSALQSIQAVKLQARIMVLQQLLSQ